MTVAAAEAPLRERGILFSAPMVRAILDGRKTVTRRIVRQPQRKDGARLNCELLREIGVGHACPYGVPGDRLWVRETWAKFSVGDRTGTAPQCVAYRATCDDDGGFEYVNNGDEVMRLRVTKWTPSIFMPRWASRIDLEITDVRVERLQDITEEDAIAEGIERAPGPPGAVYWRGVHFACASACRAFTDTWDHINAKRPGCSWNANPWVWRIAFRRVKP